MEKHFLEQYKTQNKPEAKKAAEKKERMTGEKGIFQDRSERIRAYIERLENVFLNPDPKVRERNIEILKPSIYENTLIKPEDFPESHFEFHKQQLVDRGIPREQVEQNFDAEKREKEIDRVIENQRISLDNWIDYLTGDDCKYPADIKYFAIQDVLRLGTFDTQKYSFTKRLSSTTAPFIEIDHEALSIVLGAVEAKNYDKPTETYSKDLLVLIDGGGSFGNMYALTMRELDQKAEKSDLLPIIDGEWKVFERGSESQKLVDALAGKRSNLCLADIGSATNYLNQGAIEIYFSYNRAKQLTVPRIAIAYNEEKGGVYEVRGTYNKNEDVDPYIEESGVLMKRLQNLPNGESFAKKDADMKRVTEMYRKYFSVDRKTKEKTYLNPTLTKEELQLLYEINGTIEGFGYQKDPRINELRQGRNTEEDMLVIFECTREEIAHVPSQITKNTKAYVGQLEPGIFQRLPENIEHMYTAFPDKKIRKENVKIGSKSAEQLISETKTAGINMTDNMESILKSREFVPGKNPEEATLIFLTVADLRFKSSATIDQIYKRAQILGLELCSADTGPTYRLKYRNQPFGECIFIGMKQITGSDGSPRVFGLGRNSGLYLEDFGAPPGFKWGLVKFAFRLRKSES